MMGTLSELAPPGAQTFHLRADGGLDLPGILDRVGTARRANHPLLLLGTALAFLHLFEALDEPLSLPVGSEAMETGGYKGTGRTLSKTELYAMFGRSLGLPADAVINEYGMTELSTPFYTRGLGRPHAGPPWARALVIDPETGRRGRRGRDGRRAFVRPRQRRQRPGDPDPGPCRAPRGGRFRVARARPRRAAPRMLTRGGRNAFPCRALSFPRRSARRSSACSTWRAVSTCIRIPCPPRASAPWRAKRPASSAPATR